MAKLLKTEITGSLTDTGSLIVSGSQPVQLPLLTSGSGDVNPDLITNQFWFDLGDNKVKYSTIGSYGTGVWSTGGNLIVKGFGGGYAGKNQAGLAFGRYSAPNACVSCTEEFDGSTWAAGGAMNTKRLYMASAGTQNAALASSGFVSPSPNSVSSATEEYDGSSWSSSNNVINAVRGSSGGGSQNAALKQGGATPTVVACTEEYNGSSWAAGNAMITARFQTRTNMGTQNDGIYVSGATPTIVTCVELYNGTSWTATTGNITGRRYANGGGECSTNIVVYAGYNGSAYVSCTEVWDGTSWSAAATVPETMGDAMGAGSADSAFIAGGENPPASTCNTTHLYDQKFIIPFTTNTNSTWAAGGNLIRPRGCLGGAGTINAGIAFGGYNGAAVYTTCTEEYDGTAWAEGGALAIGRYSVVGAGTQNATLAFGGSAGLKTCTEEYNGSAWSPGGAMIIGKTEFGGVGSQNAALAFGGYCSGAPYANNCNEEYNGASWSTANPLITSRRGVGAGSQNATLSFGGFPAPTLNCATEEYDGTNWSTGGNMNVGKAKFAGSGAQDTALAYGGYPSGGGVSAATEQYNGSAWSVQSAMITAREQLGGNPSATDGALGIGGYHATPTCNLTEEYIQNIICTNTYKCYLPSTAAWTTGGNMNFARYYHGGAGNQDSAAAIGGYQNAYGTCHEQYDGTAWATATATPYSLGGAFTAGTSADAFMYGGAQVDCTNSVKWNGTAHAATAAMTVARSWSGGNGTPSASIVFGQESASVKCTEEFDGTSWSAGGTMITSGAVGYAGGMGGTQNAAIAIGGVPATTDTEEYNGSTWSTGNAQTTGGYGARGGTQNSYSKIRSSGDTDSHENYDGTSWSNQTCAPVSGRSSAGAGISADAMLNFGGFPGQNNTIAWNCDLGACVYYNRNTCVRCVTGTCTQI